MSRYRPSTSSAVTFTLTADEVNTLFSDTRPPTIDDVTVTSDGRRIDTPEKLAAFIEELNRLPRVDASG